MRRISRLISALGSPAALTVVTRLLDGPATQIALLATINEAGIPYKQPRLSSLMERFEDLGLVSRRARKGAYELSRPEAVAGALHHLAALGVAMAEEEGAEARILEDLARRARLGPADDQRTA